MSVQYKSADGWKNISSSSNNAVDTVAEDNMGAVTSNAVWEQSHYENAVRLNFYVESSSEAQSGTGIVIPSTYDTADKQIEYMLNYVRDISIAKDKPLLYCGACVIRNASNTKSIACPEAYTFQVLATKGASNYWARGVFINSSGNHAYSNVSSGITQTGVFWILRQCEQAVGVDTVAVNFSITSSLPSATYTAPADGIVKAHVTNLTGGNDVALVVNGVNADHCSFWRPGAITMSAPVAKGDTYYVATDNTASGDSRMFVNSIEFTRVNHWTDRAVSW